MAVSLLKLVMSASVTNNRVSPNVKRFFRKFNSSQDQVSNNLIRVQASNFLNDNGSQVPSNGITTKFLSNGYYLLFVNGVLQESNLYTVFKSQLNIISGAATIPTSAPITLIVNNFTPNLNVAITS